MSDPIAEFSFEDCRFSVYPSGRVRILAIGAKENVLFDTTPLRAYIDAEVERRSAENAPCEDDEDPDWGYDCARYFSQKNLVVGDKHFDTPLEEIQRLVRTEVKRALEKSQHQP